MLWFSLGRITAEIAKGIPAALLRFYCAAQPKKPADAAAQGLQTTPQPPEQDDEFRKQCRRNWARLLKKIYEVDPLTCTRCGAIMQIISFIEDPPVIRKILLHLHLWEGPKRSPPSTTPPRDFVYDPHFFAGLTG